MHRREARGMWRRRHLPKREYSIHESNPGREWQMAGVRRDVSSGQRDAHRGSESRCWTASVLCLSRMRRAARVLHPCSSRAARIYIPLPPSSVPSASPRQRANHPRANACPACPPQPQTQPLCCLSVLRRLFVSGEIAISLVPDAQVVGDPLPDLVLTGAMHVHSLP